MCLFLVTKRKLLLVALALLVCASLSPRGYKEKKKEKKLFSSSGKRWTMFINQNPNQWSVTYHRYMNETIYDVNIYYCVLLCKHNENGWFDRHFFSSSCKMRIAIRHASNSCWTNPEEFQYEIKENMTDAKYNSSSFFFSYAFSGFISISHTHTRSAVDSDQSLMIRPQIVVMIIS